MANAYIGLGSNLGKSRELIQSALVALDQLPQTSLLKVSQLYRSVAIGPGEQPDYINGAALISTQLSPVALLDGLQHIEANHQRTRGAIRWTARTLDLDLLLYDFECIQSARLTVPHPRIAERNFVLFPLRDITPDLQFPNGTSLQDLIKQTHSDGIEALAEHPPYTL